MRRRDVVLFLIDFLWMTAVILILVAGKMVISNAPTP